jgi:hypothetical protein
MFKRHLCIGIALGFALTSFVFAEDNSADLFASATADTTSDAAANASTASSTAAAESSFTLKLSGSHEADYHAPIYGGDDGDNYTGNIKTPALRNDLGAEVRDGNVKLVSHWGFDVTPASADAQKPNQSWSGSLSIKPYENYISWSPDGFKLSAGYQIFSWGVADRKNPTDNLNPKDYSVGINPDKIPVLAGDAVWYPTDKVSIEGVFIPSKSASEYPEDFAGVVRTSSLSQLMYPGAATVYDQTDTKPKDFVAGGKLNYNSAGLDLSLDYLYDQDQYYTPEITTKATQSGYLIDSITLDRKRIHRIGGDAKTTIGKYGLWLESAYSITENSGSDDYSVRKSKLEYTLGTDVNYGPNDTYYANLQYIGAWIPGYDKDYGSDYTNAVYRFNPLKAGDQAYMEEFYQRSIVNSLGLDTEGLMQGATCNLKWELADALFTPQVTAVYTMPFLYNDANETRYGALALNPEIDFKPVDSFHIKIGSDLYYAWHKVAGESGVRLDTTNNAIGVYTPSNNVYIKVVYKWNDDIKK